MRRAPQKGRSAPGSYALAEPPAHDGGRMHDVGRCSLGAGVGRRAAVGSHAASYGHWLTVWLRHSNGGFAPNNGASCMDCRWRVAASKNVFTINKRGGPRGEVCNLRGLDGCPGCSATTRTIRRVGIYAGEAGKAHAHLLALPNNLHNIVPGEARQHELRRPTGLRATSPGDRERLLNLRGRRDAIRDQQLREYPRLLRI